MVTSSLSLMSTLLLLQFECPWSLALWPEEKPLQGGETSPLLSQRKTVQTAMLANINMWTPTVWRHTHPADICCVCQCAHTHTHPWSELSILSISPLKQENKRAPAAASQQSSFSCIVVTYKGLNINTLLCIDWQNTCHYNGPVDISE